ncbi:MULTISPECIES: glycosyltransferase [unclassified Pseudovibrio]|uniref:glycosyltransferase family protein n=1 Tax=unclassified Pseudovibrio TaxID=2627060 RepID=UPI0007AE891E|nr:MULTISPECIES: glycosyltransferase [unclassified Pseudovibrio]KZK94973.1 UDP-N-acetylglucosamine--N-acetylmuramyl-(pentapeptide) pyrophosphoryl-undecaprenol N-acetylglucosamine transferase [Pseudovibrio sp. W74]KZL08776.1 UDP-N-acetylglucosamine--N-acetylmuramyl-(pentapeptide) pyrophosphoryl-undecaprenol N-acetylglucosamine transferase [Pseudovibrio sp. Ad14]
MTVMTPKILIYSHDTFGLGHLRRCRTIAQSLVGSFQEMSVLILSGSPIIGSFEFRSRVDFVRIPGVIKLRSGEYTSLSLQLDINETIAIRSSIIEHTAKVFKPDIFIVDKEPLGLRGEVLPSLQYLKGQKTRLVLGLRDVMDDPHVLKEEWLRKRAYPALNDLYDEIWVYGPSVMNNPLDGLGFDQSVMEKTLFTGYLRRSMPSSAQDFTAPFDGAPYVLVTPGGGGDGVELVDWVIRAYEARLRPLFPALIVLGPFMSKADVEAFTTRASHLRDVEILRFTPEIEPYMANATAVIGMGGYNTFCEILSFDNPALLVPRVVPRREQAIRAEQAQRLGLAQMLPIDSYPSVELMVKALANLPFFAPPSHAHSENYLGGLDIINLRTAEILGMREQHLSQRLGPRDDVKLTYNAG